MADPRDLYQNLRRVDDMLNQTIREARVTGDPRLVRRLAEIHGRLVPVMEHVRRLMQEDERAEYARTVADSEAWHHETYERGEDE